MVSFYTTDNQKSPWSHFFRLGELNRLQLNFPYSDQEHSMLVACCTVSKQVVAFCDVDARPPRQQNDPPRPYLSDLCIHPQWRRRGIASCLIQKCQQVVIEQMNKRELYIRVEQDNTPALQMYTVKLNYQAQPHDYFGVKDTTILLHKSLNAAVKEDDCKNRTQTDAIVLDYIL